MVDQNFLSPQVKQSVITSNKHDNWSNILDSSLSCPFNTYVCVYIYTYIYIHTHLYILYIYPYIIYHLNSVSKLVHRASNHCNQKHRRIKTLSKQTLLKLNPAENRSFDPVPSLGLKIKNLKWDTQLSVSICEIYGIASISGIKRWIKIMRRFCYFPSVF